jgi:hypothetical protein
LYDILNSNLNVANEKTLEGPNSTPTDVESKLVMQYGFCSDFQKSTEVSSESDDSPERSRKEETILKILNTAESLRDYLRCVKHE